MASNIFIDMHHGDLFYSLHRLFHERLGWNVYRPIGLDWFKAGYWKIAEPYGNAQDTINQYLAINNQGYIPYVNLNGEHYIEDDVYHVWEPGHQYYQNCVTLEKFKSMKFDIIMSSIAPHDEPYKRLRDNFQIQAKHVAHLGNGGQTTRVKNVITSTPYNPLVGQNVVYVHQELDPNIYRYEKPNSSTRNIYSMVNCLPYPDIYNHYKSTLSDMNFKAYGAGSPDGTLDGSRGVGIKMIEANIGWQCKPLGGLGHTAMGWFMSGRPVITKHSQNVITGGDAVLLFKPSYNCIDIESMPFEDSIKEIRRWMEPEECLKRGEYALKSFKELLNYDAEEQNVRQWLEKLI